MSTSRAWAEIDLDALTANLAVLRARVGPAPALVLVAKADAYGHGAIAVARHALRAGARAVAVTTEAEARELADAGVRERIVILGPVWGDEANEAVRAGFELCLPSPELLARAEQAGRAVGVPARVHVKVDTGMSRLGVPPDEALAMLARVRDSDALELAGVLTHLAATERAAAAGAGLQVARFERLLAEARAGNLLTGRDVWVHAANSTGVLGGLAPVYDAVRVGIAAYGIAPDASLDTGELAPVLSVRTSVVHLNELARGERVGYGATWTAARPSRVAVLPVGYDDGVPWRLSGVGSVLVRGRRAPIVGRVSMDYTTVDVTDVPGVRTGDVATLVGRDGDDRLRVEELARLAGTIPYEITCSIGKRVARRYLGGQVPSAPSLVV